MNVYFSTNGGKFAEINGLPDRCPFCHNAVTPEALFSSVGDGTLDVFFKCPNQKCSSAFIGYYKNNHPIDYTYRFLGKTSQGYLKEKEFHETVTTISPDFVNIYNEAYQAEQQDLLEICGVGYRKALEFLIKDYIIHKKPDDKAKVEKKQLGPCITEYVDDSKIKSVASRAVWVGNDETHYIRRWEGKDLNDLKKLIDLTIHWIEAEVITKSFEEEMPG